MIGGLAKNNQTVLFSSHDMEEVEKLADRLIFMNHGKIMDQGRPRELIEKHQVENLEMLYLKLTEKNEGEKNEYDL
jgi:ABC-2 type transport system ATP-binding protein